MTPELRELLPLYALNALAAPEHLRVETHLENCDECKTELREWREICADLGGMIEAAPAPNLKNRLMSRVETAPRKRGVVFEKGGILLARSEELPWRKMYAGVVGKILFRDKERGYITSLIRVAAGGKYPCHAHKDAEEIYILSGDLHIESAMAGPGDYCRSEPSSTHREAYSVNGCIFLVTASHHDEILA